MKTRSLKNYRSGVVKLGVGFLLGSLVAPLLIYASDLGEYGLFVFQPDTVIDSSEVNANFAKLGEHVSGYEGTIHIEDGNVGIGTAGKASRLSVYGTDADSSRIVSKRFSANGAANLMLSAADGTEAAPLAIAARDIGVLAFNGYDGTSYGTQATIWSSAPDMWSPSSRPANLWFETTASGSTSRMERMRITPDGNVGIGTSNPTSLLHLRGDSPVLTLENVNGSGGTGGVLRFGHDQEADQTPIAEIRGYLNNGGINRAGHLLFLTSIDGQLEERMRIQDDGKIGFGTDAPFEHVHVNGGNIRYDGMTPRFLWNETDALDDNRLWQFVFDEGGFSIQALNDAGAGGGETLTLIRESNVLSKFWVGHVSQPAIYADIINQHVGIGTRTPSERLQVAGNVIADEYLYNSDARLKTDVEPLENAVEGIACLQGVTYRWQDPEAPQAIQIGLIAQDVEACFPELVSTGPDGYKSVSYARLVSPLIEAVKEQQSQLTSQRQSLAAQQAEFNQQGAEIVELRERLEGQQRQIEEMRALFLHLANDRDRTQ